MPEMKLFQLHRPVVSAADRALNRKIASLIRRARVAVAGGRS